MMLPFRFPFRKGTGIKIASRKICSNPNVYVIVSTRLGFAVPLFESFLQVIAKRTDRVKKFNSLTFILQDKETQPASSKGALLLKLVRDIRETVMWAQVNLGDVIQINKEAFSYTRAVIHFYVDMIVMSVLRERENERDVASLLNEAERVPGWLEKDLIAIGRQNLWRKLFPLFNHEFTHAETALNNQYQDRLRRIDTKLKLIDVRLEKRIRDLQGAQSFSQLLIGFRHIVEMFVLKAYDEGLAEYYQRVLSDSNFHVNAVETLLALYKDAFSKANGPLQHLKDFAENLPLVLRRADLREGFAEVIEELKKDTKAAAYPLGLHMVYTVVMAFGLDDKFLLEMRLGQFMRLYEQACDKFHMKPLISLSSGKGMLFDYKEMLRLLYRAERAV